MLNLQYSSFNAMMEDNKIISYCKHQISHLSGCFTVEYYIFQIVLMQEMRYFYSIPQDNHLIDLSVQIQLDLYRTDFGVDNISNVDSRQRVDDGRGCGRSGTTPPPLTITTPPAQGRPCTTTLILQLQQCQQSVTIDPSHHPCLRWGYSFVTYKFPLLSKPSFSSATDLKVFVSIEISNQ